MEKQNWSSLHHHKTGGLLSCDWRIGSFCANRVFTPPSWNVLHWENYLGALGVRCGFLLMVTQTNRAYKVISLRKSALQLSTHYFMSLESHVSFVAFGLCLLFWCLTFLTVFSMHFCLFPFLWYLYLFVFSCVIFVTVCDIYLKKNKHIWSNKHDDF
jgi:hypothetical protein